MKNQTDKPVFLYLAPIRGVTDHSFRNIFFDHFDGYDGTIAPFINPQRFSSFKKKHLADVVPENNKYPIIPQLLHTDATDFLALSRRLLELGYKELNWNLGCPAPMVTRKKRGSGLLPYPEKIISLLERVMVELDGKLSVKTRLGYESEEEIRTLLPLLDDFNLTQIIIHSRTGKQRYRGTNDTDAFDRCQRFSRHQLVYNGDIVDVDSFTKLQERFPDINRWMIGRGALADPFIGERIKGKRIDKDQWLHRLASFHGDLYKQNRQRLSGPGHLLGRMKQIWVYLQFSFPQHRKLAKKILRSKSEDQYKKYVRKLFDGVNPFKTTS